MEAGKRLRLRKWTYPTPHRKSSGGVRFQSPYNNRWASYNNTAPEPVNSNESRHEAPSPKPDTQSQAPTEQLPIPKEPEGSLLQAFRAELAKIIAPSAENAEKPLTPSTLLKLEEKDGQSVPVDMHRTSPPALDASATKLVLQAITSICSDVTTLNSQLRHQVTEAIPASQTVTPGYLDVHGACWEFRRETDRVIQETLHKEIDSNFLSKEFVQRAEGDLLANGVQCLRKITAEFELLRDRLLAADEMKHNGLYNHGSDPVRPINLVIDPVCERGFESSKYLAMTDT